MKTTGIWGAAPTRLYKFKKLLQTKFGNNAEICVVGASDGKFVFPFLRSGMKVTAYEIDSTAVHGGEKEFPIAQKIIKKEEYVPNPDRNPIYKKVPSELRHIQGLKKRAEIEELSALLTIREENFYKQPPEESYEGVFTSCSIPYQCNFDIPFVQIINSLKKAVKVGGYLYMDYMLPLEDCHSWRPEHYIRRGTLKNYFKEDEWKIIHWREQKNPVFEAAHVDRPENHFHRFGYILIERLNNDVAVTEGE